MTDLSTDPSRPLARLSFWVPAERLAEFEAAYEQRIAPILKNHGLIESAEQGRPAVEGIFSRLFSVDSPAAVAEKEKALQEDPGWQEVVQNLGATLGAAAPDGPLRWRFWFYRAPAGPGKQVPAGSGKDHWHTSEVRAVDRDLNYSEPDPRDARIDELEQRVRERTRELAEKNRALIVEAALERVRGQALGMQQQGDFLPVAVALFRELGTLGIRAWRSGFWIIDKDTGLTDVYTWGRWGEGQEEQRNIVRQVPLLGFRVEGEEWGKRIFAMWSSQQVFRFGGAGLGAFSKDRNQWVEYMRAHGRYEPDAPWPTEFSSAAFGNFIPFSHGILTASTPEPLTDEQVEVLQKFAGVLSLAYTRFLDLQAAEERARQQARALAVERVRAEAMAMRSSEDLRKVVAVMWKEMVKLGVETPACTFQFVDEEADRFRGYMAQENPRKHGISWASPELVELDADTVISATEVSLSQWLIRATSIGFPDFVARWRAGDPWTVVLRVGENETIGTDIPGWGGEWKVTNVPFQYGTVGFRERQHSEEHIAMVQDLTKALELGYLRFLDFQQLEETHRRFQEAQARMIAELEQELQTAHDLQMGLMPREAPRVPGFEFAGRCATANHVGGDFFQYFPQEDQLLLCLADVTGHAMEAAIPMVMFSGILHSEMRHRPSLAQLFANLNQTLHARLDRRTFVCFSMVQLELPVRTLRLANAGCPYPYHYRAAAGEVAELQMGTYPLGVCLDATYRVIEIQLALGDRVVFCSDGIIEAVDERGEMFGFERTAAVIRRGCQEGLSAEALLEGLMGEVRRFRGDAPQGDDQTVVVVAVKDTSTKGNKFLPKEDES